jgi:NAD(P)-dependent dehydrogenase (short-subunit alcohol dehydrogenase family)
MNLAGKKIWLIGATHGIGEALLHLLVAEGAMIGASGRSIEKLTQSENILPIMCDVSSLESLQKAYGEFVAHFGKPDMLIYNAGFYEPMNARNFDLDKVEQTIDVNLVGAIRALHVVLPEMDCGTIALVGSVAGYRGLPNAIGYGLSKAALIHLAENLRQDLSDDICVQIINPGFVKTRLTAKNDFKMPFCITPEAAAAHILRGLKRGDYEIHFPKQFTLPLKLVSSLPARIYFWLSNKLL